MGSLQRGDIPTSAVDFHVSSIVQGLLQQPAIAQAATEAAGAGAGDNAEHVLQRAMWRCRSSVNRKQPVQVHRSHLEQLIAYAMALMQEICFRIHGHVAMLRPN